MNKTLPRRRLLELTAALAVIGGSGATWAQAPAVLIPPKPYVPPKFGHPIPKTAAPMKIGVIGSGIVGGTLGGVWSKAGHQVMFSDRDPATSKARAEENPGATSGTPQQAIAFGTVILVAIPFGAMPDFAREYGAALKGKTIFETTNPTAPRDGDLVAPALAKGTGLFVSELLPGVHIARGFNTFGAGQMASEAHRPGDKVAIPLAASDAATMALGVRLIRDAGFDPVEVGDLSTAKKFELRGPAGGAKIKADLIAGLAKTP